MGVSPLHLYRCIIPLPIHVSSLVIPMFYTVTTIFSHSSVWLILIHDSYSHSYTFMCISPFIPGYHTYTHHELTHTMFRTFAEEDISPLSKFVSPLRICRYRTYFTIVLASHFLIKPVFGWSIKTKLPQTKGYAIHLSRPFHLPAPVTALHSDGSCRGIRPRIFYVTVKWHQNIQVVLRWHHNIPGSVGKHQNISGYIRWHRNIPGNIFIAPEYPGYVTKASQYSWFSSYGTGIFRATFGGTRVF